MRLRLPGLTLAFILPAMIGCRQSEESSSKKPKPPPPPPKVWTSEEIAQDPAGYLQSQDAQVEVQIQQRNTRLLELQQRRAQIQEKQGKLSQNVKELQNVQTRLQAAVRRADDEDRWPAKMGGKEFDREKAKAILQSCEQYIQDRRPLAEAYDQTLAKLSGMEAQMRKDLQDLGRLRERIALDIERIKLNQGIEQLGELRKAETELASFSKTLSTLDENALDADQIANKQLPATVDAESLLK